MNKELEVNCPKCKKRFSYYSSEARPFCSNKCQLIDVGRWLNEDYKVAGRDNSVYIEDADKLQELMENGEHEL